MGLLDGVLGGIVGAGLTTIVQQVIEQNGGLEGLVRKFQDGGLGHIVQSWIGSGANHAVTPDQINQVLGSDAVQSMAAKLGLSPDQLAAKLAEILPGAVDKMTPDGAIPPGAGA